MITLDGNFQLKRKASDNDHELVDDAIFAPSPDETALWGDRSEVMKFKDKKKKITSVKNLNRSDIQAV